jgi:small-conductance mechanosensitive channel
MRSPDNVMVDVPNKTIAGGIITNLSAPTSERASIVVVSFDYEAPPEQVKECLIRAARRAHYVMSEPSPLAFLKDFGDSAMHYEIKFWVEKEEQLMEACDAVRTGIWHEARKANLKMPYPMRTLRIERPPKKLEPEA